MTLSAERMSPESIPFDKAVATLRALWLRVQSGEEEHDEIRNIIDARPAVLARYQDVFDPGKLSRLTEDNFREFLQYKNNRHWRSLPQKDVSRSYLWRPRPIPPMAW